MFRPTGVREIGNTNHSRTYNDIDGFVEIDDNTILVDDWHGGNASFREHVYNIEDGRVERGSGDGMVRVVPFWAFSIRSQGLCVHVGAYPQLAQRQMKLLDIPSALQYVGVWGTTVSVKMDRIGTETDVYGYELE